MTTISKFITLIETIAKHPGLNQSQLAAITKSQPCDVSRYLKNAIKQNWITYLNKRYYLGDFFNLQMEV